MEVETVREGATQRVKISLIPSTQVPGGSKAKSPATFIVSPNVSPPGLWRPEAPSTGEG